MKRGGKLRRHTPLKRTPLKRGTSQLKRTGRLPRISKDERKRQRDNAPFLTAYRREFPLCQCGCRRRAESIHEIIGGPCRKAARQSRPCILHLAEIPCHRAIQYWPKAKQLALKLWSDPQGFDLIEFNRIRKWNPVSMTEVDAHMPEVL